jgi:hypothetical protein
MEVSESQSLDGRRLELAKCYSQLETHNVGLLLESNRRSGQGKQTADQASPAVQHNFEHTDLNIKQLEHQWFACPSQQAQYLGNDPPKPTFSFSSRPQSLRTTTDVTVTSDCDELTLRCTKQNQLSTERDELAKA